jgi:proteasome lid subunit RPN8/RPN11
MNTFNPKDFSRDIILKAKEHALQTCAIESCGYVAHGEYFPCVNIHETPDKCFKFDASVINPLIISGELQAIIHSHVCRDLVFKTAPSEADMKGQLATGVPWGVIDTDGKVAKDPYWWGDFILNEPILEREFHAGIEDCYTLIRKWYWQHRGIKLIEFPRDEKWWDSEKNLYVEGFEKAGFYRINRAELKDGDVVLGKARSTKINHGGIYLDNKVDGRCLILHHLPNRLSRREAAMPWLHRAEIFLRYKDAN